MKTALLSSLTAKVATGIAGVALVAGSTGTVLALQPTSETKELPASAADAATEATGRAHAATTENDDAEVGEEQQADDAELTSSTDTFIESEHENFGAWVSGLARDGGVDGQTIAAAAHARNQERRDEPTTATAAEDRGGRPDHAKGKGGPGDDDEDDGELDAED